MLSRKRQRPKVVKTRGEGKNKSWMPGRKGQGGEGLSHGHGGGQGGLPPDGRRNPRTSGR